MNKVKAILVLAFLAITVGVSAQHHPQKSAERKAEHEQRKEKFKAMKVEFITSKLELTSEEAEKFWPVYNEFEDKMHALQKKRRDAMKKMRDKEGEPTDKEVEKMIDLNFEIDQEMLNTRMAYDAKFKEVLPIQKVGKLYLAEEQFKREVMRKMKKQNAQHKPQSREMQPMKE